MKQPQGARVVQPTDPRVYDPRCDREDVALRALVALGQQKRWDLLEEMGVDTTESFRSSVLLLGSMYGYAGRSRELRDESAMAELRFLLPELVPVAQSMRVLYNMVTRHEKRVMFA